MYNVLEALGRVLFKGRVGVDWAKSQSDRGLAVVEYRDFYEGRHRVSLPADMQVLFGSEGLYMDYTERIVTALANRLQVNRFVCGDDEAEAWCGRVMASNRFDAMQMDVHEAVVRDGDTFVMVSFDEKFGVRITHEPSYDGYQGVLGVYDLGNEMIAVVKIWVTDRVRVNVYDSEMITRYVMSGSEFEPFLDGEGVYQYRHDYGVVPVVHFKNRAASRSANGMSEMLKALPLQRAINRLLTDAIQVADLGAFPIRYAIGFPAPKRIKPGMWIEAVAEDGYISKDMRLELGQLDAGTPSPLMDQLDAVVVHLAELTSTPLKTRVGANMSGEAMKEIESALLAKVQNRQVKFGNAWEDVISVMGIMQKAHSVGDYSGLTWNTEWRDSQLRNDKVVIEGAVAIKPFVSRRFFLERIAAVYGMTHEDIERELAQYEAEMAKANSRVGIALPGFSSDIGLGE